MMLRRQIALAFLPLGLIVCVFLLWLGLNSVHRNTSEPARGSVTTSKSSPRMPATVMVPITNALPKDDRPEVKTLYNFANEISLYNFNPEIIVCQTNQKFREMEVATPTHSAEIVRGFVFSLHSHYDSSDTRGHTNAMKEWYKCTGTWPEKDAVRETLDLLRRLGRTGVADVLAGGPHEFEAEPIRVPTPDGRMVKVTPFATIHFHEGNNVLQAEYRMGSNGPAGLTRWFYLGP